VSSKIELSQFENWQSGYFVGMIDTRTSTSGDASASLSPRKSMIYVVDDDYDVRTSLRFLLETEGFDVRTFRSGSALLGSSTRNCADCLVVDYKMAELDGLELVTRLRRLDVSTPIILITGYPDENISAKASSASVRQVLLKPNLEDNLIDCVRNAIDTPRASTP
jgi:two-component system, LuxR family, response regulator FixJ